MFCLTLLRVLSGPTAPPHPTSPLTQSPPPLSHNGTFPLYKASLSLFQSLSLMLYNLVFVSDIICNYYFCILLIDT